MENSARHQGKKNHISSSSECEQVAYCIKKLMTFYAARAGALSAAGRSYPASKVRAAAERSYPTSEVRAAAERSYPTSEVRGSSLECLAVTAQEQPRGTTLCPRSGVAAERSYPASEVRAAAERSYPASEVRGGWEKPPHA